MEKKLRWKKKKNQVVTWYDSQVETPQKKQKQVVVAFTGFLPTGPYDFIMRKKLAKDIETMKGQVIWGDTFDSSITHVVAPTGCRTMKTLIACLTGRWLVTPDWILKSNSKNKFVKETQYGYKRNNYLFEGKKVFISNYFKTENESKHFHEQNFSTLIETLGRGEIIQNAFSADLILVSSHEKEKYRGQCLTWQEFFEVIQPMHQNSSESSGILK